MVAHVKTAAFLGLDAQSVEVQVLITGGLPSFQIVGLPDKAVAESKERIRGALQAIGLALPPKRITVNLAPADLLKEGSHFDLPIAVGLLVAMGAVPQGAAERQLILGELGLDGRILPVAGVLSASLLAANSGLSLVCPHAQAEEAVWAHAASPSTQTGISDGARGDTHVIPAPSLLRLINHFSGQSDLLIAQPPTLGPQDPATSDQAPGGFAPDLSDIKGQETAKRVLEIAAAGGHNLLLIGPPGSGKSMLAERMAGILPPLTALEALEVTMVQSAGGMLNQGKLVRTRPFRAPHHSASLPALTGGGAKAKPGEVTLSHNGVLFLDELPEFSRAALDALRQPMETGDVTVARANAHVTYPARFQLIAAMNPCRCGYLGDPQQSCRKAPLCGMDYQTRVSGPIYDRMDLVIEVPGISALDLSLPAPSEGSAQVAARVRTCQSLQRQRNAKALSAGGNPPDQNEDEPDENAHGMLNARLPVPVLEKLTKLDSAASALMTEAAGSLQLSARGYYRILRVARTIADLAQSQSVLRPHLAEALAYRRLPAAR